MRSSARFGYSCNLLSLLILAILRKYTCQIELLGSPRSCFGYAGSSQLFYFWNPSLAANCDPEASLSYPTSTHLSSRRSWRFIFVEARGFQG
ncbi:hypothetical protein BDQ17DRAFT_1353856 [Cyathus striatus]|nr:hypothetical protein BDQ17DRAFT_1353856 [Cyathus striatus]